jgi:butyrate kinase
MVATVYIVPGKNELLVLSEGAVVIRGGEEKALVYTAILEGVEITPWLRIMIS